MSSSEIKKIPGGHKGGPGGHSSDAHGTPAQSVIERNPRAFLAAVLLALASAIYFGIADDATEVQVTRAQRTALASPQTVVRAPTRSEVMSLVAGEAKQTLKLQMYRDEHGRLQTTQTEHWFYPNQWTRVEFDSACPNPRIVFSEYEHVNGGRFPIEFRFAGWSHSVTIPVAKPVTLNPPQTGRHVQYVKPILPGREAPVLGRLEMPVPVRRN